MSSYFDIDFWIICIYHIRYDVNVWEIELYEKQNGRTPVLEFLDELNPKEKAKVIREIDLLAEFGPALIFPHTGKMEGDKNTDLYELRPQMGNNISESFILLYLLRKM